jgi:hypothetical protein
MTTQSHQIYCDEAGNTGAALLDKTQPVFVLSSLDFFDSEATELLACVESTQGAEVKFASLKKSERGKRRLIKFLAQQALTSARVKTTVFHKEYMVVTKLVDIIVETLAHEDGIDLYEQGGNIALSNLIFVTTPIFCGQERFQNFLDSFVLMIRNKDKASIDKFFYNAWQLYHFSIDEEHRSVLAPFLIAERSIHKILESIDFLSLDPAIPSFFNHCVAWGDQYGVEFDVLHDESKPLYAERETLLAFMDKSMPYTEVGYDRRKFCFPLKALNLNFGDSKQFLQLQMADLIASASAYLFVCRANDAMDAFARNLEIEANLDRFAINALWPSKDVTPEELGTNQVGGINAVNFIAEALSKKSI